jgi:hypothetical protein
MAQIHFHIATDLSPDLVLAALTDFGPLRAQVWPNIDDKHFQVHGQGPGWADVTEGNSVAGGVWEREKYTWDATAGTVAVETTDSNTWAAGSRWDYKLSPSSNGGTEIEVTVERRGKGWKGRLIELGLLAVGPGTLRRQMERALELSRV